MANYKRKRRHPLRACRLCKFHKYMGNSNEAKRPAYRPVRERMNVGNSENA